MVRGQTNQRGNLGINFEAVAEKQLTNPKAGRINTDDLMD
jgi:hypothetical protein